MCVHIDFQAFGMFHANRAPILHQDQHYLQTYRTEHPLEPLHLGVPTSVSKRFLRLWGIRCKLCTYLAPKLTMSPNGPKRDSICHTSSRSFIGYIQLDFQAYGMFHANHAPTLHKDQQYLQTGRTKLPLEPLHPRVPNSASKIVSQTMVHQAQTVHLSCTKTYNTTNRPKQDSIRHVIQEFHWVRPN